MLIFKDCYRNFNTKTETLYQRRGLLAEASVSLSLSVSTVSSSPGSSDAKPSVLSLSHTWHKIKNKVAFQVKSWLTDLIRNIPYSFSADPLAPAFEVVWNFLAAQGGRRWVARYLFAPHCQPDKRTAVHQSSNIWQTAHCSAELSDINKDQLCRQEHIEKFQVGTKPRGNVLIKSILYGVVLDKND